jgi:hypothetical protein
MYLASVTELFLGGGGGRRLDELPEPSAGIGEAPRRQLNAERIERSKDLVTRTSVHANLSSHQRIHSFPRGGHEFL